MFYFSLKIANLRSTRRSRDSEEKEEAGKVVEQIGELREEEEEDSRGLKRVEKEEGGSGMESLLHCDSQSSGIFSQVDKFIINWSNTVTFGARRALTGRSAPPGCPGTARLS